MHPEQDRLREVVEGMVRESSPEALGKLPESLPSGVLALVDRVAANYPADMAAGINEAIRGTEPSVAVRAAARRAACDIEAAAEVEDWPRDGLPPREAKEWEDQLFNNILFSLAHYCHPHRQLLRQRK